jgi:hypothetical protein
MSLSLEHFVVLEEPAENRNAAINYQTLFAAKLIHCSLKWHLTPTTHLQRAIPAATCRPLLTKVPFTETAMPVFGPDIWLGPIPVPP